MPKANSALRWTEKILNVLADYAAIVPRVMVVAMMVIIVIAVFSRYALNRPLAFADEYVTYLMVGVSLLAANWVLREKGHIRVDIVVRLLAPRVRAWLLVFTDIVSIFAITIIMIQVTRMTAMTFVTGTVAVSVLYTPLAPIQLMIPIAFGLLLLEFLRTITISIKSAISFPKSES